MKVRELVDRLSELDPLTEVYVGTVDDRERAVDVHLRTEHSTCFGGRTVLIEGAWDL